MHRSHLALALALALALFAPTFAHASTGSPTFGAAVTLPSSSGFGEPSIAAAPDGTIYVAAPGSHTSVWRSSNAGASFQRVHDSLGASGDSDIAVDANGIVYESDLFNSVPVSVSLDKGSTIAYESATISGSSIDRQWTAASGNGNVWSVVRDGSTEKIATSHDKGVSWTSGVVAEGVGLQGDIFAANDSTLFIPYSGTGMNVAISRDAGASWTQSRVTGASSSELFPAVASDAGGYIYVAWSAKSNADLGYNVFVARSKDGGASWSQPKMLSQPGHIAIFPWVTAGTSGRAAVAWYDGRMPVNEGVTPDAAAGAQWVVDVAETLDGQDGFLANWDVVDATPVFHTGSICTMGTACFPVNNPVALNRMLLDFFEIATAPNGDILITYSSDVPTVNTAQTSGIDATSSTVLKVVRQNGGPNLHAP